MAWAEDKSPEVTYLSADLYFAYNIVEEEINLANHHICPWAGFIIIIIY